MFPEVDKPEVPLIFASSVDRDWFPIEGTQPTRIRLTKPPVFRPETSENPKSEAQKMFEETAFLKYLAERAQAKEELLNEDLDPDVRMDRENMSLYASYLQRSEDALILPVDCRLRIPEARRNLERRASGIDSINITPLRSYEQAVLRSLDAGYIHPALLIDSRDEALRLQVPLRPSGVATSKYDYTMENFSAFIEGQGRKNLPNWQSKEAKKKIGERAGQFLPTQAQYDTFDWFRVNSRAELGDEGDRFTPTEYYAVMYIFQMLNMQPQSHLGVFHVCMTLWTYIMKLQESELQAWRAAEYLARCNLANKDCEGDKEEIIQADPAFRSNKERVKELQERLAATEEEVDTLEDKYDSLLGRAVGWYSAARQYEVQELLVTQETTKQLQLAIDGNAQPPSPEELHQAFFTITNMVRRSLDCAETAIHDKALFDSEREHSVLLHQFRTLQRSHEDLKIRVQEGEEQRGTLDEEGRTDRQKLNDLQKEYRAETRKWHNSEGLLHAEIARLKQELAKTMGSASAPSASQTSTPPAEPLPTTPHTPPLPPETSPRPNSEDWMSPIRHVETPATAARTPATVTGSLQFTGATTRTSEEGRPWSHKPQTKPYTWRVFTYTEMDAFFSNVDIRAGQGDTTHYSTYMDETVKRELHIFFELIRLQQGGLYKGEPWVNVLPDWQSIPAIDMRLILTKMFGYQRGQGPYSGRIPIATGERHILTDLANVPRLRWRIRYGETPCTTMEPVTSYVLQLREVVESWGGVDPFADWTPASGLWKELFRVVIEHMDDNPSTPASQLTEDLASRLGKKLYHEWTLRTGQAPNSFLSMTESILIQGARIFESVVTTQTTTTASGPGHFAPSRRTRTPSPGPPARKRRDYSQRVKIHARIIAVSVKHLLVERPIYLPSKKADSLRRKLGRIKGCAKRVGLYMEGYADMPHMSMQTSRTYLGPSPQRVRSGKP
ncbi:MAG: hypothetical protein EBU88_10980 [Acidobacteria bacterium]|nr:hypothetical protein [Acidobacteriota bacterium]